MDWLDQTWAWYVSGPLIGLTVPLLLILAGKNFGISSSFRHLGSICFPQSKLAYLRNNDWSKHSWNLVFVAGIIIGAYIGANWFSAKPTQFLPDSYHSGLGVVKLAIGGLLIGFGTRYAGGCTSGHSIMGLSNLSWSSLVATIFFFVGGLTMTHLLGFLVQ